MKRSGGGVINYGRYNMDDGWMEGILMYLWLKSFDYAQDDNLNKMMISEILRVDLCVSVVNSSTSLTLIESTRAAVIPAQVGIVIQSALRFPIELGMTIVRMAIYTSKKYPYQILSISSFFDHTI